jgi:hypothetical protein
MLLMMVEVSIPYIEIYQGHKIRARRAVPIRKIILSQIGFKDVDDIRYSNRKRCK